MTPLSPSFTRTLGKLSRISVRAHPRASRATLGQFVSLSALVQCFSIGDLLKDTLEYRGLAILKRRCLNSQHQSRKIAPERDAAFAKCSRRRFPGVRWMDRRSPHVATLASVH
ncbi:MAG: hypothetical protein J3Q66DRAFT_391733 [Benniella sp.]|nr:MAG: hypothetical protein J3Q66DRAFT_391733 [Benniella sp.]